MCEDSNPDLHVLQFFSRVKTVRKSDHILSLLSIKSATVEDSGNYSCSLPNANLSDTVRIVVVDGKLDRFILVTPLWCKVRNDAAYR